MHWHCWAKEKPKQMDHQRTRSERRPQNQFLHPILPSFLLLVKERTIGRDSLRNRGVPATCWTRGLFRLADCIFVSAVSPKRVAHHLHTLLPVQKVQVICFSLDFQVTLPPESLESGSIPFRHIFS